MASENSRNFQSKNLQMAGYKFFQDVRSNEEFCDVTFHIGGKTILANRIVIAAAIPYYQQLWLNKNGTYEENTKREFIMPHDIDSEAFENLIEFAYSGDIVISNENVKNLLIVAWHLHVKEIIEACCDFLVNDLKLENVFEIRKFACVLECAELVKDVDDYICENFTEISQMEEFCILPLQCVEDLLKRDDLRVSNEEKVFVSVMKWVNKCPEKRKANLPELLKKVRMNLLDPLYLKNHVASECLIRESIPCRDLLDEARNYHFFPNHQETPSYFSSEPRCNTFCTNSSTDIENMYVFSGSVRYTAQYFNQQQQIWERKKDTHFYYLVSASAVIGAKIYFFHGNVMMKYDPSKDVCEFCQKLNVYKCSFGTASLSGKIYVCGGHDALSYFKTVESYDTEKETWENLSDMQERRSAPGVTTLAACIYVLGGRNDTSIHKSVEKYDLRSGKWRAVPSMLTARWNFGCATLNGRIYACGGCTASEVTPTVEVFDPVENQWKFISSMNTMQRNFKLLPYNGKLFAVGGNDANDSDIHNVETYDPDSNKWESGKKCKS